MPLKNMNKLQKYKKRAKITETFLANCKKFDIIKIAMIMAIVNFCYHREKDQG